jgi:hypothetical protein
MCPVHMNENGSQFCGNNLSVFAEPFVVIGSGVVQVVRLSIY